MVEEVKKNSKKRGKINSKIKRYNVGTI